MTIRAATVADIPGIQRVRNAVRGNRLSNPGLVTDSDCAHYMTARGKGWVCEVSSTIAGFAIADLEGCNIWALFVAPEFEKRGIGRRLHEVMLDWYFSQTSDPVWLGTAPDTRAELFYRQCGWKEAGTHGRGEIRFEMSATEWKQLKQQRPAAD